MTATDFVGGVIDRLLERRYGAPYSPKWWKRFHDQSHSRMVMLACPECPDAAELGQMIRKGPVITSFDDFRAAMEASSGKQGERDMTVSDLPRVCGCARTFGYDSAVACICDPRYEGRSPSTDTGREFISRLHDAAQEPMSVVIASIEAEARVCRHPEVLKGDHD